MMLDFQRAKRACLLVPLLLGACATNYNSKFDEAQSRADSMAMLGLFHDAGRHMDAFADRLPAGNFYRALALSYSADYYAASRADGAAMAALRRCMEGTPESHLARGVQDRCRTQLGQFSRGEFTTPERVREGIATRSKIKQELDEEELQARRSAAAPTFVPPPAVIGAPPVRVPGPGTQPAGSNRGMPRNYCVATDSAWRDTSSGRRLHVMFKNNCPIAVRIGWCEQRADGSCGSGGGSPELPPGGAFATTFLGGDAVRPRYIACSASSGYNTSPSLPEWYCGRDR